MLSPISEILKKQKLITEENSQFLKKFEILERKFHHLNCSSIHDKKVDDYYYTDFSDNNNDQSVQKIDQNPPPSEPIQNIAEKVEEKPVENESISEQLNNHEQANYEKNEQFNYEDNFPYEHF